MLAFRLVALAERYVGALEAASAVDAVKLREARALLAMAQRATQTPRQRLLAAVRPVPEVKPRAHVIKANVIDVAGTPGKTAERDARRATRAAPDHAVDGIIEDARPDRAPRQPHPAAIRREDVALARRK
jgi:hypothetical protein